MKERKRKRLTQSFALLLCVCIVLGMIPAGGLALEENGPEVTGVEVTEAEATGAEADGMAMTLTGDETPVTLDVADGEIVITDDGYEQDNGGVIPHTGAYVLTGSFTWNNPPYGSNDYVQVIGGTQAEPIRITLDNVIIDNTNEANSSSTGAAFIIGGTGGTRLRGHVALTLEGDNVLKSAGNCAGIELVGQADNLSTLTIDGGGTLEAVGGGGAAGIGGSLQSISKLCYLLTINDGTITARGGENGSGIGGGKNTTGGEIVIHGGNVTALGGNNSAGIGGGVQQSNSTYYDSLTDMSITIDGGTVKATGGDWASGIGTGYLEYRTGQSSDSLPHRQMSISIGGDASVTAEGGKQGAAIGQGYSGEFPSGSPWIVDEIAISGGTVFAYGGGYGTETNESKGYTAAIGAARNTTVREINITGGDVTVAAGPYSAGIGSGYGATSMVERISVTGGTVDTAGGYCGAGIGSGFLGNLGDIELTGGTITAQGGGYAAGVGTGYTSSTAALPDTEIRVGGSVDLTAIGGIQGAGIGQGYCNLGAANHTALSGKVIREINISGGTVVARGDNDQGHGAGIGGALNTEIGDIVITGGDITAAGGIGAAAIGSGSAYGGKEPDGSIVTRISRAGDIRISGGTVRAVSGENGSAIGAGSFGNVGEIELSGCTVDALSLRGVDPDGAPNGFAPAIGSGYGGTAAGVIIRSDAAVTATAGYYSAGIGRGGMDPVCAAFPIVVEDGAAVTAYAMGDVYAKDFKADPADENEPTPDAFFLSAIDQECLRTAGSSVAADILMGDFKAVPNPDAEQAVTITSSAVGNTPVMLTLPAGYASFACSVPSGTSKVTAGGLSYLGDTAKRSEADLNLELDTTAAGVNAYWMLQPVAAVTFQVVNGTWSDGTSAGKTVTVLLTDGKGTLSAGDVPTGMKPAAGYEGGAWNAAPNTAADGITANVTYLYSFTKSSTGGGGGDDPKPVQYTLSFVSNGGSKVPPEKHNAGATVQLTQTTSWEGHEFLGWYSDIHLTVKAVSVKMTGDRTVYAKWYPAEDTVPEILNGDDHYAYIVGRDDGLVYPQANITRAEVATILFRLLKDEARGDNLTSENVFSDANAGDWFNTAVSTMASLGIIKGRGNTYFDPNANITRAEFAAMTARFDSASFTGADQFSDIAGHWARDEINRAAARGWIKGDGDGTFRPDDCITRAEAMTLINRVLARQPSDSGDLLPGMRTWADNMDPSAWYYLAVQEATNSHEFERKTGGAENWTRISATPDWTKYEK